MSLNLACKLGRRHSHGDVEALAHWHVLDASIALHPILNGRAQHSVDSDPSQIIILLGSAMPTTSSITIFRRGYPGVTQLSADGFATSNPRQAMVCPDDRRLQQCSLPLEDNLWLLVSESGSSL
jgi:hypothetical protein